MFGSTTSRPIKELRNLEGQIKSMEAERDIPKDELHEIKIVQECAILAPLIKAARGEEIEFDRAKHAIVDCIDIAINMMSPNNRWSDAFKQAKDMINEGFYLTSVVNISFVRGSGTTSLVKDIIPAFSSNMS